MPASHRRKSRASLLFIDPSFPTPASMPVASLHPPRAHNTRPPGNDGVGIDALDLRVDHIPLRGFSRHHALSLSTCQCGSGIKRPAIVSVQHYLHGWAAFFCIAFYLPHASRSRAFSVPRALCAQPVRPSEKARLFRSSTPTNVRVSITTALQLHPTAGAPPRPWDTPQFAARCRPQNRASAHSDRCQMQSDCP